MSDAWLRETVRVLVAQAREGSWSSWLALHDYPPIIVMEMMKKRSL